MTVFYVLMILLFGIPILAIVGYWLFTRMF